MGFYYPLQSPLSFTNAALSEILDLNDIIGPSVCSGVVCLLKKFNGCKQLGFLVHYLLEVGGKQI